jgi:hypothetical protein
MTIIELVTNLYFLYSIIWVLLGLWIIERKDFKNDEGQRVFTVLFSPIVFIYIIVVKILNLK